MSVPFFGEIRIVSFNFAPQGWAFCDGRLLPIAQNQALFSLLGTTYGGDGVTNFALPNLQGKTPIHVGGGHTLGELGGEQAHTLAPSELPTHTHLLVASSTDGNQPLPTGNVLATSPTKFYNDAGNLTSLLPGTIVSVGGSQAHLNMQPFLVLNFCIALVGAFPDH